MNSKRCASDAHEVADGLIDLVNQGLAIVDIARQVVEMLERFGSWSSEHRTDAHDHLDHLVGQGCWQRSAWARR